MTELWQQQMGLKWIKTFNCARSTGKQLSIVRWIFVSSPAVSLIEMRLALMLMLALACLLQVETSSLPKWQASADDYPSTLELSEDGLSLMEPAIVPEPKDGGRWWYTPSRKAHFHSAKSKSRLMQKMMSNKVNEDLRLPGDVLPSTYSIRLLPFIEEGNFTTDGHIDIFVDCIRDTNSISMNAAEITFKLVSVTVKQTLSQLVRFYSNMSYNFRCSTSPPTVLWR